MSRTGTGKPLEEKFWALVEKGPECWNWRGTTFHKGYGSFRVSPTQNHGAHRVAYVLSGRTIPQGYHVDHLCGNRLCVNPAHLEAVTPTENARRGYANRYPAKNPDITQCIHGHSLLPDNVRLSSSGRWYCRTCEREAQEKAT